MKEAMPHILVVIPRMIYPALSGGQLRILSLLRRLSNRYRFSILTFLERGLKTKRVNLAGSLFLEKEMVNRVHFVPRPITNGRKRPLTWMPKKAARFKDKAMKRMLYDIVENQSVDLVHIEFSEMGQYAGAVPPKAGSPAAPKVRDEALLRGGAVSRRVPVALTVHDTGFFSLRRSYLKAEDGWKRLFLPWDWARRFIYHWQILRHCDRVVAVSEEDRRRLSMLMSPGRIEVIPTGVDLEKFPFQPQEGREPNRLVYVGHYRHYPNEDAALFLCHEILPRIHEQIPGASLTLVGSDPTEAVMSLASNSVDVTGTVLDVQPYLEKAQVFLAPIRLGYGIKGKILEAFASGTPVVATPQACEGIPGLRDGEHVLLAQDGKTFARKTALLLRNPSLRQNLAAKARTLVEMSFGWDQQAERLARVYDELLGATCGARLT